MARIGAIFTMRRPTLFRFVSLAGHGGRSTTTLLGRGRTGLAAKLNCGERPAPPPNSFLPLYIQDGWYAFERRCEMSRKRHILLLSNRRKYQVHSTHSHGLHYLLSYPYFRTNRPKLWVQNRHIGGSRWSKSIMFPCVAPLLRKFTSREIFPFPTKGSLIHPFFARPRPIVQQNI